MSSTIASFFSSFISTVHADASSEQQNPNEETVENSAEETVVEEATVVQEEEEEEEPEDAHPQIREECKTAQCAALTKHFEDCQTKVLSGQGFKGEDCVEELMMHCVDEAAAPKLFSKLR